MKNVQKVVSATVVALGVAGCAASPDSIKPASISTAQYAYLNCEQLATFKVTLTNTYQKVADEEDTARNMDAATLLTLGIPIGSMTHENVPYQIWDLKGRIVAVEKLQAQHNCFAARQALKETPGALQSVAQAP